MRFDSFDIVVCGETAVRCPRRANSSMRRCSAMDNGGGNRVDLHELSFSLV